MRHPFRGWVDEVAMDDVLVDGSDINAEARENLWSFSLTQELARDLSEADVREFVEAVVAGRRDRLSRLGARAMVMYWWFDEMAGQLRCSLVSAGHGRLPFGAETKRVAEIDGIA